MYHPVWTEHFSEHFQIRDGMVIIDRKDPIVLKSLAKQINDNVYKNIRGTDLRLYDRNYRFAKKETDEKKLEAKIDSLVKDPKLFTKQLFDATDKILGAHRNTRLALIMMTGPFLIAAKTVWYIIKLAVLYIIYKGSAKKQS